MGPNPIWALDFPERPVDSIITSFHFILILTNLRWLESRIEGCADKFWRSGRESRLEVELNDHYTTREPLSINKMK